MSVLHQELNIYTKGVHMYDSMSLGEMNGPAVGIIMKEMARRAINAIRGERLRFEVTQKEGYGGKMDDMLTSADTLAQQIYLRTIEECFPNAGVIAEEDSLSIECKNGCNAYFTVDPLDGTKAFVRRQSHGVGTMLALVENGEVIGACVGDVNTQELYYFRPGSDKVHRMTDFGFAEDMECGESRPLKEQYVLLRDPEQRYSLASRSLINSAFKNQIVDGASIGTWLARLWKGEVGAAIIPPGWQTPWDSTPIIGISNKLGYKFLRPISGPPFAVWEKFEPPIPREKYLSEHDTLIVHERDVAGLFPLT